MVGVVRTKLKDYNSQKKSKHTELLQVNTDENFNEQSTDYPPDIANSQSRQKKHRTTKEEAEILFALKVYKDNLLDNAISSVYEHLSEVWIKKKVRDWWNYHKDK